VRSLPRFLAGSALFLFTAAITHDCGKGEGEIEAPPPPDSTAHPGDPPRAQRHIVEEMRFATRQERSPADGGGRAWIETETDSPTAAIAGRRGSWTILYEAGPLGIAEGGIVRLTVSAFWGWSPAQAEAPHSPGYTTVESLAEGVVPEITTFDWLDIKITGRALEEGEQLRIVYGVAPEGARTDRYAESGSRFWISVDGDGDGVVGILPDSPSITVEAGPPARLLLTLPSTAEPGDRILARAAILDRVGNRGCRFVGDLSLETGFEGLSVPAVVHFTESDRGVRAIEIEVKEPGGYRLIGIARAEGEDESVEPRLVAMSNPLLVAERNPRILWGDLHGHSNISDGTGTPAEYLSYARDVAGLDIIALTDHDHWGMLALHQYPELWGEVRKQIGAFHDPGSFVTILGYEWTNWIHGHRHVLYFGGEGEVFCSFDEAYETPDQLWEKLRGRNAMTIAHHSAGGPIAVNWDFAPDPELEPVTEIASVHGSSEARDAPRLIHHYLEGNSARDALDRGYRLGFIGSGDSHDGHPGAADIASGGSGSGLAAILADELTRESVREALQERRCYATNGARIVLRAALDGHRIGSVVPAPAAGEKMALYLRVLSPAPLAYIDIVQSDGIARHELTEETWSFETAWELEGLEAGDYLYLRVVQVDQGAAWSSPFFIE
jgi:hypothetical protein